VSPWVARIADKANRVPMATLPLMIALSLAAAAQPVEESPPICIGSQFVTFETGSAHLTPLTRQILDQYVGLLRASKFPSLVELTGSTDRVGSKSANLRLSRRRAEAVKAYLAANNFPRYRITVNGTGEDRALVDTDDGVAEPQNRYVYLFEHLDPREDARRDEIWARVGRPRAVC
jgi:outer membrane protein OmpA-like peptidoglycan-associated protein